MQAASLHSDMQAFKSCNPGSVLEDFVRWHSPRDWIQTEEEKAEEDPRKPRGQLSGRMLQPGNLWMQIWEETSPVPANKQRSLFDYTTQAEKALHYLEHIAPSDLLKQIIGIILHNIYLNFVDHPSISTRFPSVYSALEKFIAVLKSKEWTDKINDKHFAICKALGELEVFSYRVVSLFQHLPKQDQLVADLLANNGGEISIVDKEEVNAISKLFSDNRGKLPIPEAREYVIRALVPRPFESSQPVVHRMYALVTDSEFRVATAISTDTAC